MVKIYNYCYKTIKYILTNEAKHFDKTIRR